MHAVTDRRNKSIDLLHLTLGLQMNPPIGQINHKPRHFILFGRLGRLIPKSHSLYPPGEENGLVLHLDHAGSKTRPGESDNPNLLYDPGIIFACIAT